MAALTWLGGGDWRQLGERHERSTHAVTGIVVLLNAVLTWLVATLAIGASTSWPTAAVVPFTFILGVLVGAITRASASGAKPSRFGLAARGLVALAVGLVVGELAAMVLFSGSIDRSLDERAAMTAASAPAVMQASETLDLARAERTALDIAVDQARARRDEALVTARCEYNPSAGCPETRITGVPGRGPETQTANEMLSDAQRELDASEAARDGRAPALDARIDTDQQVLEQTRRAAIVDGDRGVGARWVAMNTLTLAHAGAVVLRSLVVAFFALLSLLPLILRLWRGETTEDRGAAARELRERAETEADTAIALKRAEVRAAAEIMWADQQLMNARLNVEAQNEIDRAHQQRRVVEALGAAVPIESTASTPVASQRVTEPVEEDMYLPIAAEAEAASVAAAQLPRGVHGAAPQEHLPARIDPADRPRETAAPAVPTIPDVTRAAARWIRPLVPSFVARAIDTTAHPLRAARQAFEEVEEITFTLKRTRKVTFDSEETERERHHPAAEAPAAPRRVESSVVGAANAPRADSYPSLDVAQEHAEVSAAPVVPSLSSVGRNPARELSGREQPRQLRGPEGPRQLPPAE